MLKAKSDKESGKYRNEGNDFFNKKQNLDALSRYNAALNFAKSKEKLALAYANRSAVYIETKKYEECLMNIQWARENGYPAEKIQKLNDREEKCKKLMSEKIENPADVAKDFFKLSYPPNPKIPFIVDCLELRRINNEPRLFTTRDLKPGDIIFVEELTLPGIYSDNKFLRCCWCVKTNMLNLIPCAKSSSLMFCSVKCRDETYKVHGNDLDGMLTSFDGIMQELNSDRLIRQVQNAFGGYDKLLKYLKENDLMKMKKTIFDYDFRDDCEMKKMLCCLSTDTTKISSVAFVQSIASVKLTPVSYNVARGHPKFQELREKLFYTFLSRAKIFSTPYSSGFDTKFYGMLLFTANIQNSCMPNVEILDANNTCYGIVSRTIKAGEELLIHQDCRASEKMSREYKYAAKLLLNSTFCFPDCYGCKNNISADDFIYRNSNQTSKAMIESDKAKTAQEIKAQWVENWKNVAKYTDDPISKDAVKLTDFNSLLQLKMAQFILHP